MKFIRILKANDKYLNTDFDDIALDVIENWENIINKPITKYLTPEHHNITKPVYDKIANYILNKYDIDINKLGDYDIAPFSTILYDAFDDNFVKEKLKSNAQKYGETINKLIGAVDEDVDILADLVSNSKKFSFYNQIKDLENLGFKGYIYYIDLDTIGELISYDNDTDFARPNRLNVQDLISFINKNGLEEYIGYCKTLLNYFKQDMSKLIKTIDSFYGELYSPFKHRIINRLISFEEKYIKASENYIEELEKVKNEPSNSDGLDDFGTFKEEILTKIREGKRKGFVDGGGRVDKEGNKVNITYSVSREFRHPEEYFDESYETPEKLRNYYQWEGELDKIVRNYKNKHKDLEFNTGE